MKALSLVVIFTLATANLCSSARPPQDYLSIRKGSGRFTDVVEWVLKQIEDKGGNDAEETANLIYRMFTIAMRASKVPISKLPNPALDETGVLGFREASYFQLVFVLGKFVAFADPHEDASCFAIADTNQLVQTIILAYGSIEKFNSILSDNLTPDIHPKLYLFLEHFAKSHFQRCLTKLEDLFKQIYDSMDEDKLNSFDEVISRTEKSPNADKDTKLLHVAQRLDLLGKLNIERLSNAIKTIMNDIAFQELIAKTPDVEVVQKFFSVSCHYLMQNLESIFSVYNLSRIFIPTDVLQLDTALPLKFFKINEYIRLCTQINSSEFRLDVISNIVDNKSKGWLRYIFGAESTSNSKKKASSTM